jgi:hypothetical protein
MRQGARHNGHAAVRTALPLLHALLAVLALQTTVLAQAVFPTDLPNGDYSGYWSWPAIVEQMESYQAQYPDRVQVQSIGRTYEGREILVMKISGNVMVDDPEKPEVLFMSGIHPREQPPQVALMRFVDELVTGYGVDERVTRLVDTRAIWILPIYNVDGKVYDFTFGNGDRGANWRTTRRPFGSRFGVDLNRNGVVGWGSASDEPGTQTYHGPGPISEPESQVLFDFMSNRRFRIFLDIHSALETLIMPGFLIREEAERYNHLAQGIQVRQRDAYGGRARMVPSEPAPDAGTGAGQTHATGFYIHGAYSFVFEIGPTGVPARFYPTADDILEHYERNVREPWYFLLEEAARLPERRTGSATLRGARLGGPLTPGASVEWTPDVNGEVAYSVLVSRDGAARVTGEIRMHPIRAGGHIINISESAVPGSDIPLQLILWDRDRNRSIIDLSVRVEAPR